MKKPRLTDSDRLAIETGLRSGKTVYNIAKALSRPVTTITRETFLPKLNATMSIAFTCSEGGRWDWWHLVVPKGWCGFTAC